MLSAILDCCSLAGGFVAFGFIVWVLGNIGEFAADLLK